MKKIIQKFKNKEAFTLIEMLIVLFIIAILLILIIPNITKNIDTAKDKSSEAYEKTVQSQVTAYEINEKDKDVCVRHRPGLCIELLNCNSFINIFI